MNILPRTLAFSLSLGLTPFASALPSSLTCESTDGKWHACAMDTRGGVTLVRQLSRAACRQGDTWGHDRNRIWVNRGCLAEFHVGGNHRGPGGSGRHASDPLCEYHRGIDPRRHDDAAYATGLRQRNGRNFSCASTGSGVTWCRQAVDRLNEVEIRRQQSRAACIYGHSWGVDREDVWVSQGCRAEFVIY